MVFGQFELSAEGASGKNRIKRHIVSAGHVALGDRSNSEGNYG